MLTSSSFYTSSSTSTSTSSSASSSSPSSPPSPSSSSLPGKHLKAGVESKEFPNSGNSNEEGKGKVTNEEGKANNMEEDNETEMEMETETEMDLPEMEDAMQAIEALRNRLKLYATPQLRMGSKSQDNSNSGSDSTKPSSQTQTQTHKHGHEQFPSESRVWTSLTDVDEKFKSTQHDSSSMKESSNKHHNPPVLSGLFARLNMAAAVIFMVSSLLLIQFDWHHPHYQISITDVSSSSSSSSSMHHRQHDPNSPSKEEYIPASTAETETEKGNDLSSTISTAAQTSAGVLPRDRSIIYVILEEPRILGLAAICFAAVTWLVGFFALGLTPFSESVQTHQLRQQYLRHVEYTDEELRAYQESKLENKKAKMSPSSTIDTDAASTSASTSASASTTGSTTGSTSTPESTTGKDGQANAATACSNKLPRNLAEKDRGSEAAIFPIAEEVKGYTGVERVAVDEVQRRIEGLDEEEIRHQQLRQGDLEVEGKQMDPRIPVAILGGTGLVGRALASRLEYHPTLRLGVLVGSGATANVSLGPVWRKKEKALLEHYGKDMWKSMEVPPALEKFRISSFDELLAMGPKDRKTNEGNEDNGINGNIGKNGNGEDKGKKDGNASANTGAVSKAAFVISAIAPRFGWMEDKLLAAGFDVFSISPHARMRPNVPLVVPEVNGASMEVALQKQGLPDGDNQACIPGRLIKSPNCVSCGLSIVLAAMHSKFGLTEVSATTFQTLTGRGDAKYPRELVVGNVLPLHDTEEDTDRKIVGEIKRVVGTDFRISVTAQRVFAQRGHFVDVRMKTREPVQSVEKVKEALRSYNPFAGTPFATLPDAPKQLVIVKDEPKWPRPVQCCEYDPNSTDAPGMSVTVGQICIGPSEDEELFDVKLSLVVDNVARGAYGAALLCAEYFYVLEESRKNN